MTHIIHRALELDDQRGLRVDGQIIVELKCSLLGLLIVGDIRRLNGLLRLIVRCLHVHAVDLELVCIAGNLVHALLDVQSNLDSALVTEVATKLEVIQRDCIIGRLDAGRVKVSALLVIEISSITIMHNRLTNCLKRST